MNTTAIYVHLPWCVRKCPYCDFNSHQWRAESALPEAAYIERLLEDLQAERAIRGKQLAHSVFFGGGTPSLFSADGIQAILAGIEQAFGFTSDCEITLETNPGTFEYEKFRGYREAGVNRLSIGVQSFDDQKLKALGRIHSAANALDAIAAAKAVGFDNFNIDIMHGLPDQSTAQALADLEKALALGPSHLSWYQLTIETNTEFYSNPPSLPDIDALDEIEVEGFKLLKAHGFEQYEVSAWAKNGRYSRHNLSYWQFEDYIGIGAGAHGKYSNSQGVFRRQKTRLPENFMDPSRQLCSKDWQIDRETLIFEYMLNRLRLFTPIEIVEFEALTRSRYTDRQESFSKLAALGLLTIDKDTFALTPRGQRFLNNVLNEFLPE